MLGKRICKLRKQRGWTQAQLAKKLKVSSKTIKSWEADISNPSAEHILGIARLFSVSIDYVFEIGPSSYISLDSLSPKEEKVLRAISQTFISEMHEEEP